MFSWASQVKAFNGLLLNSSDIIVWRWYSHVYCRCLVGVGIKLWNYKEQSKHQKSSQTEETTLCCFCKNTYNTVLEVISKQANSCFRQFTGWCGSALSHEKHLQLYLEKEIKPKFFVSKYANKVIFFSKIIIQVFQVNFRLKTALVGLYKVPMPSFNCVAHLQEQVPKHSQSWPRGLELRATVLENKNILNISKQPTTWFSCFSHLALLEAFSGNTKWNIGISDKKSRWFQQGQEL